MALAASGCDQLHVLHKPRLLSKNDPSYVAGELADYLANKNMRHVSGVPFHPQTQGKIERWHQTLKNRIPLENCYLLGELAARSERSSNITTTSATRRAGTTSLLPTPNSAGHKPSSNNAKGSNADASNKGGYITANSPHNINPTDGPKHSPILRCHIFQII